MERFSKFYKRELNLLVNELNAFVSEDNIWVTLPNINNSAGNLSLHIIGNLQHFIGHIIGGSDYKRDRDAEFSTKNVARQSMIDDLHSTANMIEQVLGSINEEGMNRQFPIQLNNQSYTTYDFVMHLLIHLSYHVGQVNYLRRALEPTR
jgi:uncharacterized damage-inducible protein DinB